MHTPVIKIICCIGLAFIHRLSFSQCLSFETRNAASISNENSVGIRPWSNPGNAATSNNQVASSAALILGQKTNYLWLDQWGFNIPATATICGIEAGIQKNYSGLLGNVTDNIVKIVKNGTIGENNYANSSSWTSSLAYSTYGGNNDDWGETWSPSDINSNNFGLVISANLGGISVLPTARIDHVYLKVYYSNPLPVNLLYFNATCSQNNIKLEWSTASQVNCNYFEVEKSNDAQQWEVLTRITAAGNSTAILDYAYNDLQASGQLVYYRLAQYDFNHNKENLATLAIRTHCFDPKDVLVIAPNPAGDKITIRFTTHLAQKVNMGIYQTNGKCLKKMQLDTVDGENFSELDITELSKGSVYLVRIENGNEQLQAKFLK
jgi:hypothetical protein